MLHAEYRFMTSELPLERQLSVAMLDSFLPNIDLHGMRRDEVAFEIEQFVGRHPRQFVRIVFGSGTGVLSGEVVRLLKEYSRVGIVEGFEVDAFLASCVVKIS